MDDNNPITSLEIIGERGIQQQLISSSINPKQEAKKKMFGVRNNSEDGLNNSAKFYQRANNLNQNSAIGIDDLGIKRSCLSPTLLSNYVLGISLLKNIAMKHSYADNFASSFDGYMQSVKQVEQSLF